MLSFTGSLKVWVCVSPCDMRSGAWFVFCNKRHTRLKVLYFDGSGVWVMAKRLEKGTLSWPRTAEVQEGKILLAPEALAMLTDGGDLHAAKMRPWYRRD